MRIKSIAFALTFLMILGCVFPALAFAEPQVTKTNWTITGSEKIKDQTIILKGNLIIRSGGELSLENAKIVIEGSQMIDVQPGSKLSIINSHIKSDKPGQSFYNINSNHAEITITHSMISGLKNPMQVKNSKLDISGSTISGGLFAENMTNSKIQNNKFDMLEAPDRVFNLIELNNAVDNHISNNTFYGASNGIYCTYSWNNTFEGNVWYAQEERFIGTNPDNWWNEEYIIGKANGNFIWLDSMSNNNTVANNQSYGGSCTGYRITQSSGNLLQGNYARGNRVGLVLNFADNNIIHENQFSNIWEYEAIQVYRSHNNFITNNTISSAHLGVGLLSSKENTVSGNLIENSGIGLNILNSKDNMISGN